MERFSGEVVARDDTDDSGITCFILAHSKYVQAVTRALLTKFDLGNVLTKYGPVLRAKIEAFDGNAEAQKPATGTKVDFTFDESDLLTAVSVRFAVTQGARYPDVKEGETEEACDTLKRNRSIYEESQCPICLEIIVQPSTIGCGHSACLLCMTEALNGSGKCPSCRSEYFVPLSVNIALRDAIFRLFPHDDRLRAKPPLPSEDEQATKLRMAVYERSEMWLLNLLLCGYDPDSRLSESGAYSLAHAAQFSCLDMAQILLEHGANINIQDYDGDTALMNAVYFRRREMVEFFLSRGADPTVLSESGLTAGGYAHKPGALNAPADEDLAKLLEEAEKNWKLKSELSHSEGVFPTTTAIAQASSTEEALAGGPRRMLVAAVAPMVRTGASPDSAPAGRLTQGDEVTVTAFDVRSMVRRLRFTDGPARCPEGWVPEYLPTSRTRVLVDVEPRHGVNIRGKVIKFVEELPAENAAEITASFHENGHVEINGGPPGYYSVDNLTVTLQNDDISILNFSSMEVSVGDRFDFVGRGGSSQFRVTGILTIDYAGSPPTESEGDTVNSVSGGMEQ